MKTDVAGSAVSPYEACMLKRSSSALTGVGPTEEMMLKGSFGMLGDGMVELDVKVAKSRYISSWQGKRGDFILSQGESGSIGIPC